MKRAEKALRISQILEELYPDPPVPLDHSDAYSLLIAVLLSAQCTDERVNQVTPGLFAKADTPAKMAAIGSTEILASIRSCGLAPTKAKNVHRLSEILRDQYDGQVPADMKSLEALPGVGHKTASVVLAQVFDQPTFPVDTHIHRLAKRWGLSKASNVNQTEADLKKLFPKSQWRDRHIQIIMFGREYCPARFHDLEQCPICSWSASQKQKRAEARS